MTINKEDIKLFESQRLSDEGDGGGRATGNVVIDGQVNNLFREISRIDRTVGMSPCVRSLSVSAPMPEIVNWKDQAPAQWITPRCRAGHLAGIA